MLVFQVTGAFVGSGTIGRAVAEGDLISLVVMPIGYIVVGPLAMRVGDDRVLVAAALMLAAAGVSTVLIPGIRAMRTTRAGPIVGPLTTATAEPNASRT